MDMIPPADEPEGAIEHMAETPMDEAMEPPPPAAPNYDEDVNLAPLLPDAFRKNLAARVIANAELDQKSMEDWAANTAKHVALYKGQVPEKVAGQDNVQPMHLPYVRKAVRTFKAKAFPQLYPPTGDFVAIQSTNPAFEISCTKVTRHMNRQLRRDIREWVPSHDRGFTQGLISGAVFEVWYYDPLKKRPAQEIVLSDDFWLPYKHKSDCDDLSDQPRKTWRKRYYRHELKQLEAAGYYAGITRPMGEQPPVFPAENPEDGAEGAPAAPTPVERGEVKETSDRSIGQEPVSGDPDAQRVYYEHECWLMLPGEQMERLALVCVDVEKRAVVRVATLEMDDPQDAERYSREENLRQSQIANGQMMHEQAMAEHQAALDALMSQGPPVDEMGQPPLDEVGQPMQAPPLDPESIPQEPMPPEEPPAPAPVARVPLHRWTIYRCEVDPEGSLGEGLPHDVAGHNVAANKIMTRYVTSLSVSLHPTIIASRQSKFNRGETAQLQIGKINESSLPPAVVSGGAGMFILQTPPPDQGAFRVIEQQSYEAQALTAFDIATGAPSKSGTTATESEMQQSNATDNLGLVAQRWNRARSNSLRVLAYLNSITLPEEGVRFHAAPEPGMDAEEFHVGREDYKIVLENADIEFTCDPTMVSKAQRLNQKMKAFQTIKQLIEVPIFGQVPSLDVETATDIIRTAAAEVMKAMDRPDIAGKIMHAPPPPQQGAPPQGPPTEGDDGDGTTDGQGPGAMEGPPGDEMATGEPPAGPP